MKASVNAVTNGAKVRDTAGRLKCSVVETKDYLLDFSLLEAIQLNTSVSPATKLHEVVIINHSHDGDDDCRPFVVKVLRYEIVDVVRPEALFEYALPNAKVVRGGVTAGCEEAIRAMKGEAKAQKSVEEEAE